MQSVSGFYPDQLGEFVLHKISEFPRNFSSINIFVKHYAAGLDPGLTNLHRNPGVDNVQPPAMQ